MYTKESIERVQECDLIDVLEKVLPDLKKSGSGWSALSPFNEERTPSFKASRAKQVWKDNSSGIGGVGPVYFIMRYEKIGWIEAIERVAQIMNIVLQKVELTEEEIDRNNLIEYYKKMLFWAKDKFLLHFGVLSENHWAKVNLIERGYSQETIDQFSIGYAVPSSNDIASIVLEQGKQEEAINLGLVKKDGDKSYDFFNDRIIFPIEDAQGRVVGFGGRCSKETLEKKKAPKYLNSPDTPLYSKEKILYGLFQARMSIIKLNYAYLTEGYTDVMGFHNQGVSNTIATCGTALTPEHLKIIKKLCSHLVIVRDGDKAGLAATYRDIDLALAEGLKVSVVELKNDDDPDTLAKAHAEKLTDYLKDHTRDALKWKSAKLRSESTDPDSIAASVNSIAETMMKIKDPIRRKEYIKECAKLLKVTAKDVNEIISKLEALETTKRKRDKASYEDEKYVLIKKGFPEDGDVAQYKKDGYAISMKQKCVFFKTASDTFFQGTNFVPNPLYMIKSGKGEGKRLIEFTNDIGEVGIIELNNKEINGFTLFQDKIVDGYNFTFEGATTAFHFKQFKNKMLYNFKEAWELGTLGQQPEGFFAFANGVVVDGQFFEVDSYGIIEVDIEVDPENGKPARSEFFYSPAFSKFHTSSRADDDSHEGVRAFAYKESPIVFNQWMTTFHQIYGEKSMLGISFVIASLFRDIILNQFSSFPHFFLSGQKQSGKTSFAESLTFLFTPGQKSFDLNTGSMVGFFRRSGKIRNILVGFEEFNDNIHEIKKQTLKAAFDDRGRETGMATGGKETNLQKINSACIILSQYLSSWDDNSLTSRSIVSHFVERNYTPDEKMAYAKLKAYEKKGMTSMLLEILKYRPLIQSELTPVIEELNRQLITDIKSDYMERMLENFVTVMAPMKILFNKFSFPFEWKAFYDHCKSMIVEISSMISETEGTATFWRALESLLDQKPGKIHAGEDFIIQPKHSFPYNHTKEKENEKQYDNSAGDDILFLRLGKVHQDYVNEVSRRQNEDPINEVTLRGYFKSKPYYIGPVRSMHFSTGSGSCYAFNYTMMEKMGVVNLRREKPTKNDETKEPQPQEHPWLND
jgi:DNA primase